VRRAHAGGARVSAHVFGEEALPDLLAAGIDCVEHGTGLSRDLLAAMAESGTALVPTLVNIDSFPGIAAAAEAKFPTYAAHMRRLHASARGTVRTAYEAGVRVFAGSDAGSAQPHGLVPQEVRELAAAGLPAADALAAGSWAARDWLGRPCLQEGAPADLVVYAEDPRADLRILRTPARVILRGRVVA
jgi:imidazolonepropionase-like amidohydrolase